MAIQVVTTEQSTLFTIRTKHTTYQMKADEYGVLLHLWYGASVEGDMSYLLDYPDVGFSGNLYEAENRRTYSLNTLPLEYATEGVGDFRIPAVAATHADGSNALDLRYQSYSIHKGKYAIAGLPSVYADEDEAETLEIVLKDTATDLQVTLRYGVLPELDMLTRCVSIQNLGTTPITLTKAASFCLDLPYGKWEWMHFHGRHAMERITERTPLIHGIQESSSTRGTSSHHQNPTAILCTPDCTETNGSCFGAAFLYSGSFQTKIEYDQMRQARMVMGLHPDLFRWELQPNATFDTPEVLFTYSDSGLETLSHRFQKTIREHVCRGKYQKIERPVLINNWEATYFDFNEEKILKIAEEAARLGVDMLVLDDGWFGKRDDDCSGLGDWFVNEQKLRGGLGTLVQKVKALGMRFGIWFEPEMISEDSDLYRTHPDWALTLPGRKPAMGRNQLVLDLSRPEVVDYLAGVISKLLREHHIEYIKWDMNRSMSDVYSCAFPAEQQGEIMHRYMLGVYALAERLTQGFPEVLFEGCAGGGGRFDAGMLCYYPQIWCSDDTDAIERLTIQHGTSFGYPVCTMGAHVSACPNHQTGRTTPIDTRAVVAMSGTFGYELDLGKLKRAECTAVKNQIKRFKRLNDLIRTGDYYRLTDPAENAYFTAWQFAAEDGSEALLNLVVTHPQANPLPIHLCFRGLEEDAVYELDGIDYFGSRYAHDVEDGIHKGMRFSGSTLLYAGLVLPQLFGDYPSVQLHLTREG